MRPTRSLPAGFISGRLPRALEVATVVSLAAFVNDLIWVTGGGTQIGGSFGSLYNQTYRPAVSCE